MAKPSSSWKLIAAGLLGLGVVGRLALRRKRGIDVRGKTVLVTGGSRGLGLALARRFAEKGANLALCARDAGELERVRDELGQRGTQVFTGVCDVTREDEVERFVAGALARFGAIDVVVTNAATIRVGPLANMTREDFAAAMDDIFWGTYNATMAVLPSMRARGKGNIVHVCSIGGRVAVPHLAPYSTAKFAVAGFSEALRSELRRENIAVTTILPGLMRTGSHVNAAFKGNVDDEYRWFSLAATLPLLTISADRAAREIVDAVEGGESERVLSLPAKVLALLHGIAPGLVGEVMALQNQVVLPDPGPEGPVVRGRETSKGAESVARPSDIVERFHQVDG